MEEDKAQTTEQTTGQATEGQTAAVSTPETMDTHAGGDASTHGVNTNLDPNMQGGPATPADQAATQDIERQHVQDVEPG